MTREETGPNVGRRSPVPEWQVLVVGDGVAGLATAGLLKRVGLDPVVVGDGTGRSAEGVLLSAASLGAFAELGLAEDVRSRGSVAAAVLSNTPTGQTVHVPPRPLYVADRRTLRDVLERLVPGRFRHEDTAVVELECRSDMVTVTFEGGITERFDAVVGCDGPGSTVRSAVTDCSVDPVDTTTWHASVDATPEKPTVVDGWRDDAVLTVLPDGDRSSVRLTVAGTAVDPLDAVEELADRDRMADGIGSTVADCEGVRGVRQPTAPTWTAGRVALVGDAARPVHPATGTSIPAALEDARVMALALADGTGDIDRRLARYGVRRREARSRDAVGAEEPTDWLRSPLERVYAARTRWLRRTCLRGDGDATGGSSR